MNHTLGKCSGPQSRFQETDEKVDSTDGDVEFAYPFAGTELWVNATVGTEGTEINSVVFNGTGEDVDYDMLYIRKRLSVQPTLVVDDIKETAHTHWLENK